jgi:hypothetical protein
MVEIGSVNAKNNIFNFLKLCASAARPSLRYFNTLSDFIHLFSSLVKHERPTRIVHRLMPKATIEAEDISARTTGRERSMQELVAMNIMLKGRRAYVWIVCEDAEQANALTHQ